MSGTATGPGPGLGRGLDHVAVHRGVVQFLHERLLGLLVGHVGQILKHVDLELSVRVGCHIRCVVDGQVDAHLPSSGLERLKSERK